MAWANGPNVVNTFPLRDTSWHAPPSTAIARKPSNLTAQRSNRDDRKAPVNAPKASESRGEGSCDSWHRSDASRRLHLTCFLLCGRDDVGFQATQQHRVIGVVKGRDNLWVVCQRIGKQSPFRLRPEQEWSNRDGEQAWNNGGQFLRNAPRISEVGNYETGQVSKGGDGFSEIPISRLLEIE